MKILYITLEDLSLQKGSVVHVLQTVGGLRRLGHQVDLVARFSRSGNPCEIFSPPGNRFTVLNNFVQSGFFSYLFSSVHLLVVLIKTVPRHEIIFARDFHTALIAFLPRCVFRKKLVLELNGLANEEVKLRGNSRRYRFLSQLVKVAERMAVRSSSRLVSVTPQIVSYIKEEFSCSPEKVTIVGNGVDVELFRPIADKERHHRWKRELGIEENEQVVAFVGNLAPWQGVDILAESGLLLLSRLNQVEPHGQSPWLSAAGVKFLIVGDGVLKGSLQKRLAASEFEKNFIFTGAVDHKDVPILINIADICVAPFIWERNRKTGVSPLKVYEYLACGKPVVASRIEGVEFLELQGIGKLVKAGDSTDLSETLLELLKDEEKRLEMGKRGFRVAREKFSWDGRVREIEKVLLHLA